MQGIRCDNHPVQENIVRETKKALYIISVTFTEENLSITLTKGERTDKIVCPLMAQRVVA
jgi:hypothetical protein